MNEYGETLGVHDSSTTIREEYTLYSFSNGLTEKVGKRFSPSSAVSLGQTTVLNIPQGMGDSFQFYIMMESLTIQYKNDKYLGETLHKRVIWEWPGQ